MAGRYSQSGVTDAGATGLNDADGPWWNFEFNFGDDRSSGGTRPTKEIPFGMNRVKSLAPLALRHADSRR